MSFSTSKSLTFPGGIHPPEKKSLTLESEIHVGFTPKEVAVMLSQHIGAVCKPLVEKGSLVQAGEKIGDSEAFVCAPVHSPVTGKVKEIVLNSLNYN